MNGRRGTPALARAVFRHGRQAERGGRSCRRGGGHGATVNVFLQYYALDAFRADRIRRDHALSADATGDQAPAVRGHDGTHWSELFRQAKDVGEVGIHACALSMEMFKLTQADLDPLVDDVEGVAAFMAEATGPMVFI
jgi:peroxiredoxin family protein